jgi:hypothetical protein
LARQQPNLTAGIARGHAVSIILDLVRPSLADQRLLSDLRVLRLDEARPGGEVD